MKKILTAFFALTLSALPLQAVELGDDGLHKTSWMRVTFNDMSEDLADANAEGKRLLIMWEQRGCIYCTKMHKEVFVDPEIEALIEDNFFVVQMNLFGDEEVIDFDGTSLSEKEMARRWGIVFTPTLMFFPPEVPEDSTAGRVSAATMPGAFGKGTTRDMLTWILEEGYNGEEHFQHYHARKINERRAQSGN